MYDLTSNTQANERIEQKYVVQKNATMNERNQTFSNYKMCLTYKKLNLKIRLNMRRKCGLR